MQYTSILQRIFGTKKGQTPQVEPLIGQVANNAGGYYYAIDDWALLNRFLILGTEAGTYYVSPTSLTKENAEVIIRLLEKDGLRVVCAGHDARAKGSSPLWAEIERSIS